MNIEHMEMFKNKQKRLVLYLLPVEGARGATPVGLKIKSSSASSRFVVISKYIILIQFQTIPPLFLQNKMSNSKGVSSIQVFLIFPNLCHRYFCV
jgi:hypothetical protein